MAEEIYRFDFGNFKCMTFNEANRLSPADQMYSSVPDEERAAVTAEFGLTEGVPSAINVLLIDTGSEKILVDTGLGRGSLHAGLAAEGIEHAAIDHIIITHGHGDHIGGIIDEQDNLVFPNAHYWIGKTEWDSWNDKENRNAALRDRVRTAIPAESITILPDEKEFMPGFTPVFLPGHCIGMMGLLIESDGQCLIQIADVIHHPLQVKYPEWCVNFDEDKPTARQTRRSVWQRAADENLLVVSYHAWKSGRGYVTPSGDTWRWQFA